MSYDIETKEFIQILHSGLGHWVTASTIGCQEREIYIFDSIPPAPTAHLVNQIAALLATQRSSIQLKYVARHHNAVWLHRLWLVCNRIYSCIS